MPLLDHFCPPLATERHWESFYLSWAVQIATYLNRLLPDDNRATPHICFGIDLDEEETLPQGWQPSAPDQWLPFSTITQSAEVLIHSSLTNPSLVGAVGFVCKANKAHPIERQALVAK